MERVAGEVGVFLRNVRKAEKDTGAAKNTTGEGGVKQRGRKRTDYSRDFSDQIEDYKNGNIKNGDTLLVGKTPDVFLKIGMNPMPVTINTTHVEYALNGTKDFDHQVGEALLKQLPEAIKKPVAIMTSSTKTGSSLVVMLEMRHNRKQVVVPAVIDGFGYQNGIQFDSNAITSMYGKNHSISKVLKNAINDENNGNFRMYYLDVTKATALLQVAKVPMPKMPATHDGGFIHNLSDPWSPVKLKYGSVTETQQFKRWFGDWKNHPENASKVVNADGTPKVVYHGTNNDFTVFQSKSGMYWFSETEDYAEEMAYFKDIDGQYYRVPITAGMNGNEETVYSIGEIRKRRDGTNRGSSSNGGAQKKGTVPSGDIIVYSVGESQVQNSMKEAFDKAQREKEGKRKNSREMDTVKALERQNALMKERVEYWKEQTRKRENIGKKADRAEVRKIGRQLIRNYSSNTNIEEILPDLQRIANQNDSYSDMVDAAEGIARKILEGSGVDANADLAQTRERLKKYLRIKWMRAGKL